LTETQLYQLNHQVKAFKDMALLGGELDPNQVVLEDRVSMLHPEIWRQRREAALLETQRLYE